MSEFNKNNSIVFGICLIIGLSSLGYLLGDAAIRFKEYERTVTVKGLSEREYQADIVIWPIQFSAASNHLEEMYSSIDGSTEKIKSFLANVNQEINRHLIGNEHETFSNTCMGNIFFNSSSSDGSTEVQNY